ncbi:MAG: geranylgeranyl reductase family protein [Alcanivorax sp.]|nr:geranylgeranyl reductase family protein [Alcanivorax sp.]
MSCWDVVIVGAGQAGCAAAWDLAAAGRRVLILDRASRRPKPCAGGLTAKTLQRYRFSVSPVVREVVSTLWVGGRRQRSALTAGAPFCVMTERAELDRYCLQQACSMGAQYLAGGGLVSVQQDHQGVLLHDRDGHAYRADYVIAADGAHSPLRRLLGIPAGRGAMAIEGIVPRSRLRHYPGMTLDFQVLPGGYGWLFPKGDHVNVGLYIWQRHLSRIDRAALSDYCRDALGCQPDNVAGYPLGTWLPTATLTRGRVLFAGDAAGCTEALLGEGIYGAVLSGQYAAQALLGDAPQESYPRLMQGWRDECRQVLRLADLFYRLNRISVPVLQGNMGNTLVEGFAQGLTLGECKRLWRGASFAGQRRISQSANAEVLNSL